MRDLGYVEGQNIVLERRSSAGDPAPLPKLAIELVQLKVDVLYATGPAAVRAAHDATKTIPIVAFDLETDPVATGLVRSLNRPGGNVTGLFLDLPDLAGKSLALLHQAVPNMEAVHVFWDSTTGTAQLEAVRSAARRLGVAVNLLEMDTGADLDPALLRSTATPAHPLVFLSSPIISGKSKHIAEFTVRHRLPAISAFRAFAESGGLLSYGPDLLAFRRFAATYVDKVLNGTPPADLPVQQPSTFEFVVNLQTANLLGLAMPQSLLLSATEVIK
jgi:putative ABC transport system substrate-binding protein